MPHLAGGPILSSGSHRYLLHICKGNNLRFLPQHICMLGSKCANCGNDPSLKHHNLVMCLWFQLTDTRILRYDQTSQKVDKYHNRLQKVQIMRKTLVMKIIRNILYSHNEHTQRFCLPPTCSLALGRCSSWRSWCLLSARRS